MCIRDRTYEEAGALATRMSESLGSLVKVTKGNRKKHFPKDQWWLLYDEMRKVADTEGAVERKQILVYGTPLNVDGAAAWTAYTSEGNLGFEGLSLDSYIDSEIAVLMRGKELIRVESLVSEEVVYRNIWLKSATEKTLEGYVGTITRQFDLKKELKKPGEMGNMVADLHLSGGKVKKVVLKKEKITGKVLAVSYTHLGSVSSKFPVSVLCRYVSVYPFRKSSFRYSFFSIALAR